MDVETRNTVSCRRRKSWAVIFDPPGQPAQYLRSLIFSSETIDMTEDAEAALQYFHRRDARDVIRDHLEGKRPKHWRVVPIFVPAS